MAVQGSRLALAYYSLEGLVWQFGESRATVVWQRSGSSMAVQ